MKVSKLLRIKDGHLIIKDLDFLLKDQLNVRDSLPEHYKQNLGYSKDSDRASPHFAAHVGDNNDIGHSIPQEDLNKSETVTVQDIYKLPRVR